MTWKLKIAGLAMAVAFAPIGQSAAEAQTCGVRAKPAVYEVREVRDGGLVAAYYSPAGQRRPAIIVLGGSEGGTEGSRLLGKAFADQGYAVLALAYFDAPGLPKTLEEIPLEYFDRAIVWLAAQPGVDPDRIGVYGVSRGAEAALLLGSHSAKLHAVGAGSGTHVVWQGGVGVATGPATSTWSLGGKPLPYLPYDLSKPFNVTRYFASIFRIYDDALPALASHPQAAIPVERINGPVMLISGKSDLMWPSSRMSDLVVVRLKDKGFRHQVTHLAYEDAGHAVAMPPAAGQSDKGPDEGIGGTAAGNAAGRADMWPKLVCFFDRALGY